MGSDLLVGASLGLHVRFGAWPVAACIYFLQLPQLNNFRDLICAKRVVMRVVRRVVRCVARRHCSGGEATAFRMLL